MIKKQYTCTTDWSNSSDNFLATKSRNSGVVFRGFDSATGDDDLKQIYTLSTLFEYFTLPLTLPFDFQFSPVHCRGENPKERKLDF